MNKGGLWIVILVVISIIGISYSQLSLDLAPRVYSSCITPPAYPQMITQSGTICPGTYPYGIGIGADNVKVTCLSAISATIFTGNTWTGKNGLTISGRNNITVEGCWFREFDDNGIFIGNTTAYTSQINLLNVSSDGNNESGIFVGHNVINININGSDLYYNKDGITFKANYFGPVTAIANLFPRGIVLANNRIFYNYENGINFDAFDYYAYLPTAPFILNNSVQIIGNTIEDNDKNGIQNIGFTTSDWYTNNGYSYILNNKIQYNGGILFNGSGIAIIANKSDRIINDPAFGFAIADFNYIVSNDLLGNVGDGISLHLPQIDNTNPIIFNREFMLKADNIFANYILWNGRHGVSVTGVTDNALDYLESSSYILQNDISDNGKEGIYFEGFNYTNATSRISSNIMCNDVRNSGQGNNNGVEVINLDTGNIGIWHQNIIENNQIGILIENKSGMDGVQRNYIGLNTVGLLLNKTDNNTYTNYNDFDQNGLQAFDRSLSQFTRNWWSDYSPGCLDSQPDGWCDVNRPIPIANQDVLPKAGLWFGQKARGYFVKANTGVVPKMSCNQVILPPPPIITVPTFESPQGPIITNQGEPGNPGSSQSDG